MPFKMSHLGLGRLYFGAGINMENSALMQRQCGAMSSRPIQHQVIDITYVAAKSRSLGF
jgi:hypothetical protein